MYSDYLFFKRENLGLKIHFCGMTNKFKSTISNTILNLPGWHTRRKIVVLESDDWGSIRMPSRYIYNLLIHRGIRVDLDPYCRYDSLATTEDLEALFELLSTIKDKNGNPAVLTANTVTANPDFDKIRKSGFNNYYFEPFTETLKRNKETENSFILWEQGMKAGIFHPQFHGREHLNVKKWMKALQSGEEVTRLAFNLGTFGLTSTVDPRILNDNMGAFNSGLKEDIAEYNVILKEGLDLFEKLFGYRSLSFIPTTYTWSPYIETGLKTNGVMFLQGMVHQRIPVDDNTTFKYKKNNFTGYRSKAGLLYITRNAYFEPSQNLNFDWLSDCLRRVDIAFRLRKPAIISVHRLNFIGNIDVNNRKRNIKLFAELLRTVRAKYSAVEFMSSDMLGQIIAGEY